MLFARLRTQLLVILSVVSLCGFWPGPRTAQANPHLDNGSSLAPSSGSDAYKIALNQDGLYQLSYTDLLNAGLPVGTLDPRTFQISNQGSEIAIFVNGETNGLFEPGESILFYGQKISTKFTDTNIYWLTWGGSNGLRMSSWDGAPSTASLAQYFYTTLRLEQNKIYQSSRPSLPYYDHWYWRGVTTNNFVEDTFTLQNLAAGAGDATIRGRIIGSSNYPNHRARVFLNGNQIADSTFASLAEFTFTLTVPHAYLQEGINTIRVQNILPAGQSSDLLFTDYFQIDYFDTYVAENDRLAFEGDQAGLWQFTVSGFTSNSLEVFDISDPRYPRRVSNALLQPVTATYQISFQDTLKAESKYLALATTQYLTPLSIQKDILSNLKNNSIGADWIAISHANFLSEAQRLAQYRQDNNSYRTLVVDVQDVYDEFSAGVFDPNAIHDFLAYAYSTYTPPAPQFVVLVGDGHYDFKNAFAYNPAEPVYIPPFLADVDPFMGETAADNRYVTLVGNDLIPDMHLGRLPVKTLAEAATMVDKIINYEQNPHTTNWNQTITFVADNADSAGDFAELSDAIANNYVPSQYVEEKIYYTYPGFPDAASVNTALVNAVNQGRLLVSYVGHANVTSWALEKFLQVSDMPKFSNLDRLPFFVPMTCQEGYYINPSKPGGDASSLGESIVRISNGGAIASWSPTGLGVATGHDVLERGLFLAIFQSNKTQIGPATTYARQYLAANAPFYPDLLDTYVLFGDPALKLQLPAPTAVDLASFTVSFQGELAVRLNWETSSEINLIGFNLYRQAPGEQRLLLNLLPISSQSPGSLAGAAYEFLDGTTQSGVQYQYWLETLYLDASSALAGPVQATAPYRIHLPFSQRKSAP